MHILYQTPYIIPDSIYHTRHLTSTIGMVAFLCLVGGRCLKGIWRVSICDLEGVLCVSRGCLESLRTVSVEYLDGIGIVLGACLECVWRLLIVVYIVCLVFLL